MIYNRSGTVLDNPGVGWQFPLNARLSGLADAATWGYDSYDVMFGGATIGAEDRDNLADFFTASGGGTLKGLGDTTMYSADGTVLTPIAGSTSSGVDPSTGDVVTASYLITDAGDRIDATTGNIVSGPDATGSTSQGTAPTGSELQTVISNITALLNAGSSLEAQQALNDLNVARARQGLSPISMNQLPSTQSQKLVQAAMPLALGGVLIMMLAKMGSSRGRK